MSRYPGRTQALHDSESGIRESRLLSGPVQYAGELARYIRCPTTIRARVLEQYDRAPSLDTIREMRAVRERERNSFRAASDELGENPGDRADFRVQGIAAPPKKPDYSAPIVLKPSPLMPADIIAGIADAFDISVDDLKGPSRLARLMDARRTVTYVFRVRGNSFPVIGRWLGRDHSTMIPQFRHFELHATPQMRAVAARFIGSREA